MLYEVRVYEHAAERGAAVCERFQTGEVPQLSPRGVERPGDFACPETRHPTDLTRLADDATDAGSSPGLTAHVVLFRNSLPGG